MKIKMIQKMWQKQKKVLTTKSLQLRVYKKKKWPDVRRKKSKHFTVIFFPLLGISSDLLPRETTINKLQILDWPCLDDLASCRC